MTRRIYLHIGAPKTGTTYLQDRLHRNAKSLSQHGVHFPSRNALVSAPLFHFRAALDLQGQDWGGAPGHADGAWEALVRRVKRASGDVIVSHEILAPAQPEHVARAKADLGAEAEIHIVYTARDLGRQVPAAWQESIKQGRRWTYSGFARRVRRGQSWFYRSFDLPSVLSSWGAGLPPEQVHVVTVPPRGAGGSDLLWERFCRATGVDPAWAPEGSPRRNPSLGAAETALLRRLNEELGRSARRSPEYDELVRVLLAEGELAGREGRPIGLPPRMSEWADTEAERWIEWVEASGVHIVGDVDDLRPRPIERGPRRGWGNPDRARPRDQLDAAVVALAAMTREAARRTDPDDQLVKRVVGRLRDS